jgi:N-acetylglucosaminyl-diphospho-decaprenol L-rhamnosyltransferase
VTGEPAVGVVTVTFSPGDTLEALLDSIPAACSREVAVVLADNGSTDGSVEQAAQRPHVVLVRTGGNLGYGAAANAGIAVLDAGIEWVLLVNPDVVLGERALDLLLEAAGRHPTAGALGPLITTEDGTVYPSARQLPSFTTGVGHAMFGWWWPSNPWTQAYRLDHAEPTERPAGWLSGACLLLRRAAFDQVHGFDPAYFMYFEDVDLGERLTAAGWSNIYAPSARVMHHGGRSTQRQPAAMAKVHHHSAYRYLAGRYTHWWQAPLRWLLKAGLALRAAMAERSAQVSGGAALPKRQAHR